MNDPNGNISTCNSTNLFIKNNEVWTSTGEFCLNGITRSKALIVCRKNEIICHEDNFTLKILGIVKKLDWYICWHNSSFKDKMKFQSINSNSLVNKIRILYNNHIQENISLT